MEKKCGLTIVTFEEIRAMKDRLNRDCLGILESDIADSTQFFLLGDIDQNQGYNKGLGACYDCKSLYWVENTGTSSEINLADGNEKTPICYGCVHKRVIKSIKRMRENSQKVN